MTYGNQSVERSALVLKALAAGGSLGVTDVARRVGLPKSVTHRLLSSLRSADLVKVEPKTRRYSLGYGLLQLTADWLASLEVRSVALPYLRDLQLQSRETVALNVRDGDCRVTVERLDTSFEVRFVVDLGRPLPMCVGAAGKAILAFLPDDEVADIGSRAGLTSRQESQLLKELCDIRRQGFADTCGERVPGSRSISAPIFNHLDVPIASVSILSLESRMQRREANECRRLLKLTAKEISIQLGSGRFKKAA